jgi:hypothetical protein
MGEYCGQRARHMALLTADGDREASQTRDYCVATGATHRAARLGPSFARKARSLRMTG